MIKGPQTHNGSYVDDFSDAVRLIYGTILFDTREILPESAQSFDDYNKLYETTIGTYGHIIIDEIEKWCTIKSAHDIEILDKPITYQTLLSANPAYKNGLSDKIRQYYGFK